MKPFLRPFSPNRVGEWSDVHLVLANRLGSLPRNSVHVFRLIDRLDMTIVVDWDVKPQIK